MTITTTEYTNLDQAYDYFNAELFEGRLPLVLLTFQRKNHTMGYFSPRRFKSRHGDDHTDELALNPVHFNTPDIEILQTLVHEMCHVWQEHFGNPSRGGYHNKEWAKKMIEVGLMPSDTHAPGGKMTGQSVGDYVIECGRFALAAKKLLESGFTVQWMSREAAPPGGYAPPGGNGSGPAGEGESGGNAGGEGKPKNKVKFTCPGCKANAWGKPSLNLICGECQVKMEAH